MKTTLHTFRWIFGAFFLLGAFIQSAQAEELTRKSVLKMLSDAEQVPEGEITVGPMQEVERKLANGTVAQKGICVTFIAPKQIGGIRRRSIHYRTFYYDTDWGWYLFAVRNVRGGEVIDVVSERKGSFQLR